MNFEGSGRIQREPDDSEGSGQIHRDLDRFTGIRTDLEVSERIPTAAPELPCLAVPVALVGMLSPNLLPTSIISGRKSHHKIMLYNLGIRNDCTIRAVDIPT